MRWFWAVVGVLALTSPVWAIDAKAPMTMEDGSIALSDGTVLNQIYLWDGTSAFILRELDAADFDVGASKVNTGVSISKFGLTVGDVPNEFDPDTLFGTNRVDFSNSDRVFIPNAADVTCTADSACNTGQTCEGGICDSASTNAGRLCGQSSECTSGACSFAECEPTSAAVIAENTSDSRIKLGLGGALTGVVSFEPPGVRFGGNETVNNFLFHGEAGCSDNGAACAADSDCNATATCACSTADVCRNGKCSGDHCSVTTATSCSLDSDCPASETCVGICTLTPNSYLTGFRTETQPNAVVLDVYDFNVTGGTITIDTTNIGEFGQAGIFRVTHNAFINEEEGFDALFDLQGHGGKGVIGGTGVCNATGKGGQSTSASTATAATSGNTPGVDGGCSGGVCLDFFNTADATYIFPNLMNALIIGGGGGALPVNGQVTRNVMVPSQAAMWSIGGAGGSGAACAGSCGTPYTAGDGGRGGGGWIFHVGREFRCDDADADVEFDMDGAPGHVTNASAGGGAGGAIVMARIINDTCEYGNSGGGHTTGVAINLCGGSNGTSDTVNGDGAPGGNIFVTVPF